jgi:hypothetical protein
MNWRMPSMCDNCPFDTKGPGRHLRRSLRPGFWREILRMLRYTGKHFTCHKTTHETGDGSMLVCAGSITWQNQRGLESDMQQCMERLDAMIDSDDKMSSPSGDESQGGPSNESTRNAAPHQARGRRASRQPASRT